MADRNQDYRPEPVSKGEADAKTMATATFVFRRVAELKEMRRARGLTLMQIAERSGLSMTTLSELENSKATNPRIETLVSYGLAMDHDLTGGWYPVDPEYRIYPAG